MKMNKREERMKYIIKDSAYDRMDYVEITKDQLRLLEWLQENDYLLMRDNVRKLYYEKFTKEAFVKRLDDEH